MLPDAFPDKLPQNGKQGYFMMSAANDARFNADTLMHYIERRADLSRRERLVYRHVLIPAARAEPAHGRPSKPDPYSDPRLLIGTFSALMQTGANIQYAREQQAWVNDRCRGRLQQSS